MGMNRMWLWLGVVSVATSACVTTGTYKRREAELLADEAAQAAAAVKREDEMKTAFQAQLDALQAQLATLRASLDTTGTERDKLRAQLDDTTALVAQLKKRLEKLGQNVDKLTGERGQLAQGLADAKARLDALRQQEEAAQAQAKTFRELLAKLRSMIDSGELKVTIRKGRMDLALPNDVLFDSGKVAIKPEGRAALEKVAQVLATIPDRDFLVAGNTDNVPIHTERFPSNWELSAQRAIEVVEFMVSKGMKPGTLAAAGYSEFDPVDSNDTPEHRALNRRIEIVLQPNLAELPGLAAAVAAPATKPGG